MSILPYLETFSAIVEKGSFTAAAEALNISKPVVSKQLTQLEKQLGVQLLQRTTRRMHLTQAGEVFASYASRILSEVSEAEQSVVLMQSEPQGKLRISAPESLALSLLPEALSSYQRSYPKVELDVSVSGRLVDLVDEGLDMVLRVGELKDSSLIARLLMPCHIVTCAAPGYLEKRGTPRYPNELVEHNCLVYSSNSRSDIWKYRDKKGKDVDVKVSGNYRSDAGSLLFSAALAGHGIFSGPEFVVAGALKDGKLVSILEEYAPTSTGLYAVYPYSRHVSTKVRSFVDLLVEVWK